MAQVYAPIDGNPDAFHRTVYVYVCVQCSRPVAARHQLGRANPFWPFEAPAEEEDGEDAQVEMLMNGSGAAWGALELETEPEVLEDADVDPVDGKVKELLERYNHEGALDPDNDDSGYKGIRSGVVDKAFRTFRERVDRSDPSQVVRYDFGSGTEPLWVSDQAQIRRDQVPACENCGAERWFELQVLPQALHYLKPVKGVENGVSHGMYQSFDFGTIVVYSCSKSCGHGDPSNNDPLPEFAYHQPHSAHG